MTESDVVERIPHEEADHLLQIGKRTSNAQCNKQKKNIHGSTENNSTHIKVKCWKNCVYTRKRKGKVLVTIKGCII